MFDRVGEREIEKGREWSQDYSPLQLWEPPPTDTDWTVLKICEVDIILCHCMIERERERRGENGARVTLPSRHGIHHLQILGGQSWSWRV